MIIPFVLLLYNKFENLLFIFFILQRKIGTLWLFFYFFITKVRKVHHKGTLSFNFLLF